MTRGGKNPWGHRINVCGFPRALPPSIWGVYRWEVTLAPGLPERSDTSVCRRGEANSHCSHTGLVGSSARPTRKGSSAPCGWRKWLAGPGQAPGGPPGPSPVRAGCPGPSRLSHSCSSHVLERIGALCILWKMWLTTGALGPLPSQDLEQAYPSSAGGGDDQHGPGGEPTGEHPRQHLPGSRRRPRPHSRSGRAHRHAHLPKHGSDRVAPRDSPSLPGPAPLAGR